GYYQPFAGVQIFTFSDTTLTRRGLMEHGTPVRRTFRAGDVATANVSEEELTLYDQEALDTTEKLGRLELAPDYVKVLAFGDYRVRMKVPYDLYWNPPANRMIKAEVVPTAGIAQLAEPVATFDLPLNAEFHQVGNLLVSLTSTFENWVGKVTHVEVIDLSDPTAPRRAGTLDTGDLPTTGVYYGGARSFPTVHAGRDALAFLRVIGHTEDLGVGWTCQTRPATSSNCIGQEGCTYVAGERQCRHIGADDYCSGGFAECVDHADADTTCTPMEIGQGADIPGVTSTYCYEYVPRRSWAQVEVNVVDLSDPDHPTLTQPLALPYDNEAVDVLNDDGELYFNIKRSVGAPDDPRPHTQYFLTHLDLTDPAAPALDPGINVPGEVLAIQGNSIFANDRVWGDQYIETAIARLELHEGLAYLQEYQRFPNRRVHAISIDERGLPVVTHSLIWRPVNSWYSVSDPNYKLTTLSPLAEGEAPPPPPENENPTPPEFDMLSTVRIAPWASLRDTTDLRALFEVPGGVLAISLEQPEAPKAQAFFPTWGWPERFVASGEEVLFASGRFGIHQLDRETVNLVPYMGE
ncbi:MAG TPA: hypothetical protein VL242_09790, partial [Sorangium sp.]|nr:hypothetical protein [Sorangium sp.]